MKITLNLRPISSGYWYPNKQLLAACEDLTVQLQPQHTIRGKASLCFNGDVFYFTGGEVTIPADKVKEVNTCIFREEADGTVKEWKFIDHLLIGQMTFDDFDLDALMSEREYYKALNGKVAELTQAVADAVNVKKTLAAEIVRQGEAIAELKKDIEALKNEPVI